MTHDGPLTFGGEYTIHPSLTIAQQYTFISTVTLDGTHASPQHYTATVSYTGYPTGPQLGITDTDLDPLGRWIDGTLHGHHLNDVLEADPTLETIARTLLSLALTVLETRADQGDPVQCHQVTASVTCPDRTAATIHADVPTLTGATHD